MFGDTFWVHKASGTYTDVFLVNGLASVLNAFLQQVKGPEENWHIEIIDIGPYYRIKLNQVIKKEWFNQVNFFASPAYYLVSNGKDEIPPNANTRSINATWEKVRTYHEQHSALSHQGIKDTDIEAQLQDMKPPHDWRIVAFLGDWRMQAQGIYNRIVNSWFQGRAHFREHLQTILQLFAAPNVDTAQILHEWREKAKRDGIPYQDTASQLLNPHQGKGQNELKSNVLRMDNIKDRPWPEEFLKACGLWHCSVPRQTTDTKDWKMYVIAPRHLSWYAQREAYRAFNEYIRHERKGDITCLKTDITSILHFYKAWLDYAEIARSGRDDFDAEVTRPEQVISGFYVAQFKLLSQNAYTMVNQSFLTLPSWGCTINTYHDVAEMKALINEHLDVIRSIEEGHSDGYELLRLYRDFVAGENWDAFFDFTAAYSHEILRRYNDGDKLVPTFSTTHLRRLFMSSKKPLSNILQSQGFKSVASAIRHSTIIPQSRKARQQDNLYDVHYGLGAELKRKSTVREEFITALSNFMQIYNQENVQTLESKKQQMRKDLRTSDIEEITHLIDEYGSELVASLLVAYGYARESHEEDLES